MLPSVFSFGDKREYTPTGAGRCSGRLKRGGGRFRTGPGIQLTVPMRSVPPAVAGGSLHCLLSISDCQLAFDDTGNRHSAIGNRQCHDPPATAGGTDLTGTVTIALAEERCR